VQDHYRNARADGAIGDVERRPGPDVADVNVNEIDYVAAKQSVDQVSRYSAN
jgi:hypothetical protein